MIMQTVGLHDRIELYRTKEPGIRLETNLFYLPNNEQNLAYRAAALLIEEFGVRGGFHTTEKVHSCIGRNGRRQYRCSCGPFWGQ